VAVNQLLEAVTPPFTLDKLDGIGFKGDTVIPGSATVFPFEENEA
jgi:hypothetical protein